MTDVDQLKPGFELNVLIAEEVWGWKWMRYFDLEYEGEDEPTRTLVDPAEHWLDPPKYVECDLTDPRQRALSPRCHGPKWSTDWLAAAKVLEWARLMDYDLQQAFLDFLDGEVASRCGSSYPGTRWTILLMTPLTICLAALAAVRARKETP